MAAELSNGFYDSIQNQPCFLVFPVSNLLFLAILTFEKALDASKTNIMSKTTALRSKILKID
jgi:hypothetical protein